MSRNTLVRISGVWKLSPPAAVVGTPTASFTKTQNGENSWVFDASASSSPNGAIASYAWSFGDGGTSTQKAPTHVYTTAGTWTVSLTVLDVVGAGDGATTTVTSITAFVLGVTEPNASNTGTGIIRPTPTGSKGTLTGSQDVLANTTLQGYTINGDVTLESGAKLLDCIVNGIVNVRAGASLIENNIVRGDGTDYDTRNGMGGMINCIASGAGLAKTKIQYNEIYNQVPTRALNAIGMRNYSAYRNNIHDTVDGSDYAPYAKSPGASTYDPNVDIKGNYIHDLCCYKPDYNRVQTHNDCIQGHGGGPGVIIQGNALHAQYSPNSTPPIDTTYNFLSAVMINNDYGIPKITIDKNWIYGGLTPINALGSNDAVLTLSNNIFDTTTVQGFAGGVVATDVGNITLSGNVTQTGAVVSYTGSGPSNTVIHQA